MPQMTDLQVLTLAFSIIIPLSMLIYSNSRITDTRIALQKSMDDVKEVLRAEMQAGFRDIQASLKEVRQDLRIHELEHHK